MLAAMSATATIRSMLEAIPQAEVPVSGAIRDAIDASVAYLASPAARESIAIDLYWPKWDSPWWHMVALFEVGEAARIPASAVTAMVAALEALPLHTFPLRASEVPAGLDMALHTSCHCALGTMHQVLTAAGVDVEAALPWIEPWFPRYQLADGGLNCDNDAYLVDEVASSMVGTIHGLVAMLQGDPAAWSAERRAFVDRAAAFLVERQLVLGSPSRHNAAERDAAPAWRQLCFPRFYFYDVLLGAHALVRWATVTGGRIAGTALLPAIEHLAASAPDGVLRKGREAVGSTRTRRFDVETGTWVRREPATRFPLLDAASRVGEACPFLTRQWRTTRADLLALIAAGQVA